MGRVTDVRIGKKVLLDPPRDVAGRLPTSEAVKTLVGKTREDIGRIMLGKDRRMLAVVGPCSIHDENSAIEYARRLCELRTELGDKLLVIMRTCYHKPRTVSGPGYWEGLYPDPLMDGSHDVRRGIELARKITLDIMGMGLPVATEILDTLLSQYLPPLPLVWLGARTVQSPDLRKLASGLSAACGFKNTTGGGVSDAIDAIQSARHAQWFTGIDDETGRAGIFMGTGNDRGFVILRGGADGPNHDVDTVTSTLAELRKRGLPEYVMIDASHANSRKDHTRQPDVAREIVKHRLAGHNVGLMLESHIKAGRQPFTPGMTSPSALDPEISVTDACLGWPETAELLREIAERLRTAA